LPQCCQRGDCNDAAVSRIEIATAPQVAEHNVGRELRGLRRDGSESIVHHAGARLD
jgi:hypothetical protein